MFCAFALSLTIMPASNDIASPRAVSHRQPNFVRTLFSLVISKLHETALTGSSSPHSPVLALFT